MPLNRAEWACVAFALVVSHAFLLHEWLFPSAFDATQYVNSARDIAGHGLFRQFLHSDVRTYGYPFVLSLVLRASVWTGLPFVALLFALQFLVYCGAALFLRNALAPVSAKTARIVFCGLLVDFYALIYTPESLTESLSLTLLVLAAGCWVVLWRGGVTVGPLIVGSLTVGFAFMVRPANAFMIAVWACGFALLYWRQRQPLPRAALHLVLLIVAVALPIAPQVRNNVVHYGTTSPMVSYDLGHLQQATGILIIKYATALPPVSRPAINYRNPLAPGTMISVASPWSWYFDYPLRGIATIALHTFNLTDQDLLFTYSRDLTPWYRVPLGIANHAVVALGLLGLVLLGRRVRAAKEPRWRDPYIVLLALIVANWAVYAWTAVEMRFGSILLLVMFPLAGYASMRLATSRSAHKMAAAALGTAVYVVLALMLSAWVRDQAPLIREAVRSPPLGSAPAAMWLGGLPGRRAGQTAHYRRKR